MITGSVLLDLAAVDPEQARHLVAGLDAVPTGARVVLVVGSQFMIEPAVFELVCRHVDRLVIDVSGNAQTVRRWITALRERDVMAGAGRGWRG